MADSEMSWQEAYDKWLKSKDADPATKNRITLPDGPGEAIYWLHRTVEDKPAWWLRLAEIANTPREKLVNHLHEEALRFLADMFRFHEVDTPDNWHLHEPMPQ